MKTWVRGIIVSIGLLSSQLFAEPIHCMCQVKCYLTQGKTIVAKSAKDSCDNAATTALGICSQIGEPMEVSCTDLGDLASLDRENSNTLK